MFHLGLYTLLSVDNDDFNMFTHAIDYARFSAPELLLGYTEYTTAVDIWSAGCCIAEFLNGYAIFRGMDSSDQMYRIIKIIGIPTRDDLREMNPCYTGSVDLAVITYTPRTLRGYLPDRTQESALLLLEQLLKYKPNERLTCQAALASEFFIDLKQHSTMLPNKRQLPPLFNFRDNELATNSRLHTSIVPDFARACPIE
jgi:glycogen synthase kinase 3 beta